MKKTEQRTGYGTEGTEITFIFRKIEGYAPIGLGSRSFTVDWLANWQTKIYCFLKILKFESGPS